MVLPSVTFPSLLVIPPRYAMASTRLVFARASMPKEHDISNSVCCVNFHSYYPPIQFILDLLKCLWVYSTKRFEVFQAFYSKYTSFLQVYRNMVYESAIFLLNCSFYTNNIDNARYQAEIFCHYHTIISAFSL